MPGIGAFFGNRSIVFHYANKTRISCANFTLVDAGEADYSSTYYSSATDINRDGSSESTDTKTVFVTSACPSDPAYCYSDSTSATVDATGLPPFGDATALPTDDADVDDIDEVDEVDDADDVDGIDAVDDDIDAGDDDVDGVDDIDDDSLATSTLTGAPVLSTDGAAAGVWVSGGAVFAALAALVL